MKRKLTTIKTLAGVAMLTGVIGMTGVASAATQPSVSSNVSNTVTSSNQHQKNRMPGVRGTVKSINNNIITIDSVSRNPSKTSTQYNIDVKDATIMKTDGKSKPVAGTIGDIKVGDKLAVRGTFSGTDVKASKVLDGAYRYGMRRGMGHGGVVTNINGNTITISHVQNSASAAYTIDASNAEIMKDGVISDIGAISVGDKIMVKGTKSGTNITATKIKDGKSMNHTVDSTRS